MKYIKELQVLKFRGINNLELSDLGDINIFVGANNAGKTSILEAIGIIEKPTELGHLLKIGKKREIHRYQSNSYTILENMLNQKTNSIDIRGKVKEEKLEINIHGKKLSIITEEIYEEEILQTEGIELKIKTSFGNLSETKDIRLMQNNKSFVLENKFKILPIVYITSMEHLIENSTNEIIKKGKKKELIELLTIFDKEIVGLEMIEENKKSMPYIEHKRLGLMPISTYGDGLKKVLLIGASIINAKAGVLLIDEVETAIHIDVLTKVFKWFTQACEKYKTQVFMTTHSIEVIDAILDSQNSEENIEFLHQSLRVITIKNNIEENITKVRNLNGLKALEAREDFGLELR